MGVIEQWRGGIDQLEPAGHSEVGKEGSRWFKIEQQVFTASPRIQKPTSCHERCEPFDVEWTPHRDRSTADGRDPEPRKLQSKRTADGLDFRKLGH